MFNDDSLKFLHRLLDTPGPSGFESAPAKIWREEAALESTILEVIARRDGFSRKDIHPTRFSKRTLSRGLASAGFESVTCSATPTRLALTA